MLLFDDLALAPTFQTALRPFLIDPSSRATEWLKIHLKENRLEVINQQVTLGCLSTTKSMTNGWVVNVCHDILQNMASVSLKSVELGCYWDANLRYSLFSQYL